MDISYSINTLDFDFDSFDKTIRSILGDRMAELVADKSFSKEIKLLPLDAQNLSKSQTPAITLDIGFTPLEQTMDSFQVNNHSDVTLQFDVYTSGNKAKYDNIFIRSQIINTLIRIQSLCQYRFLGMNIDDNRFVQSIINGVTRGVVRLSCIVDNKNKVITKRRM